MLLSGIMLATAGLFFLLGAATDLPLQGDALAALLIAGGVGMASGLVAWRANRGAPAFLSRRDALLLVALSWIIGAAISAMPFWIWARFHFGAAGGHPFNGVVACYFEAVSGLTTTGASVLSDIEAVPPSLLLWRSLTHWLGGIGIVVLFVAVLPGLGVGGKRLFMIEAPGPAPEGLQPHIRETARWLWYIYAGMTVVQIIALWPSMGLFDATCHTFGTLATGGFSTKNASIGAYHNSLYVDVVIIVFMVLSSVNFGLYYRLCRGEVGGFLRDTELRVYLVILCAAALAVSASVYYARAEIVLTDGSVAADTAGQALRQGAFTTVSINTTTGFCTSDYNPWPFLAKAILILMMFVGGCAGSTAGGIKVIRVWIALKVLLSEVEKIFRPDVVRPVRIGPLSVDPNLKMGSICYALSAILIVVVGGAIVMVLDQLNPASPCDYTTAVTACSACLFTTGPGLGLVGAVGNYGWLTEPAKAVLCAVMIVGRLEIFAIIVLFSPRFWRSD